MRTHPPEPSERIVSFDRSLRGAQVLGVTVNGELRDAAWRKSGGLLVAGHDLVTRDLLYLHGAAYRIGEMRRVLLEEEEYTLVSRAHLTPE